jgi:hypothetical protein
MQTEFVYLGHDNRIDLILKADGAAVDLSGANRMTLTLGSALIDSDNGEADPIRWAKGGYATGEVRLFLGGEDLTATDYKAPLVVYDGSNPEGIVWGVIPISIIAEVEAAPP